MNNIAEFIYKHGGKLILVFIYKHGWELILVFILLYAFFGDKILSGYVKKDTEKILKSSFYSVNVKIKDKISELKYEKTFIQFMNAFIKKHLYFMLFLIGIIQAVYSFYFVKNTDSITYQVELFTIVIAVFEYKNNNELAREKKIELSKKDKILCGLQLKYSEIAVEEMVQGDIASYEKLSNFDKLYKCYKEKHSRQIRVKWQGIVMKEQKFKVNIQSDKDDIGKFIKIEKKEKVLYLREKSRENYNIKFIQERRQNVIIYIIPDRDEEIKIEIPW